MTRKLILVAIIVALVFLTGGIKYRGRTDILFNQKETRFMKVGHFVEEVRGLGFYYRKIKKPDRPETSYGWSLEPSLEIFSITTYEKIINLE